MADDVYGRKFLNQKAVYWTPSVDDGTGLGHVYDDPVEIDCRWTDKFEIIVDAMGKEVTSKTYVLADRDLSIEGVLWLGKLADLESSSDPFANTSAWKIIAFHKIPDASAKKFLRKAYM